MRIYVVAACLLALYLLPWVVNPSTSLTPNGYDLAEWSSLHPVVQSQTPPLLTSLLLRLPLMCMGLMIAVAAPRTLLSALAVLVTAAALLPPLEFIRETGNPNYRQEAALALLTLIIGGTGVSGLLLRYRGWIVIGITLVGALSGLVGLAQAYDLMRGFELNTQIGIGGVGMALLFTVVASVLALAEAQSRRRNVSQHTAPIGNQTG